MKEHPRLLPYRPSNRLINLNPVPIQQILLVMQNEVTPKSLRMRKKVLQANRRPKRGTSAPVEL